MLLTDFFNFLKKYIIILVICFADSVPESLGYRNNGNNYGTALTDNENIENHEESNDSVTDQRSDHETPNDSVGTYDITAIYEEPFNPSNIVNDENPDKKSAGDESTDRDENNWPSPTTSERVNNNTKDPCNKIFNWIGQQNFSGVKLGADKFSKFKLWPEAIIPFHIDEYSFDKVLRDRIIGYLEDASSATGLTFQELSDPFEYSKERWVLFINRRGLLECKDYSTNSFTNSGVQKVILGYDCLNNLGPIAAIVLALAGVPPQHNAPNRDEFITVSMDSVIPDKRGLFKRLNNADWLFHNLDYDFDSVGHYHSYKYTVDGSATIKKLKQIRYLNVTVENENFSCRDKQKIKILYNFPLHLPASERKGIKLKECKALFRPGFDEGLKALWARNKVVDTLLSSLEI